MVKGKRKIKVWVETDKERDNVLKALHKEGCTTSKGVPIPERMKEKNFEYNFKTPIGLLVDGDLITRSSVGRKESFYKSYSTHEEVTVEKLTGPKEVRIYSNDPVVTAVACGSGKIAMATCSRDDEFDFFTGAKIALERLEKKVKEPEEPKEEYFSGRVVCVDTEPSNGLKKGKIYTVKEGSLEKDGKFINVKIKARSIEDLNVLFTPVKFIEVVE